MQGIGTETPLALAATYGLTDILKCLVQAGADPNVRDGVSFPLSFEATWMFFFLLIITCKIILAKY